MWMLREKLLGDILALSLILGGALGNIKDRYELGYVVDRNWGLKIYTVYVVDLSDDIQDDRNGTKGWIYVGQTALTREARYQQHIDGIKAGRGWVTEFHLGFNEELCARYPQVRTRVEAEALEKQAANELEAEDWNVKGAGR